MRVYGLIQRALKTMQKSNSSTRSNAVVSYCRFLFGITFISAAVAMAFVAVKPPTKLATVSTPVRNLEKFRQDRDEMYGHKAMLAGPMTEHGPTAAAEEEYAKRAYPGTDIPFSATLNAQATFNTVKARGAGSGKNSTTAWFLTGPSTANFPAVLTFSGAAYTTSGRVTALASMPTCSSNNCRVWA